MIFIRGNPNDIKSWRREVKRLTLENGRLRREIVRIGCRIEKADKRLEKARQPSLRILKKRAWAQVSRFVRLTGAWVGADGKFWNRCYTCDKEHPITELQAGHFYHGKLDYEPRQLKPQCVSCNHWKSGNLSEYRRRLTIELGQDGMDKLDADAHAPFKPTRGYLEEVANLYKMKADDLQNANGKIGSPAAR